MPAPGLAVLWVAGHAGDWCWGSRGSADPMTRALCRCLLQEPASAILCAFLSFQLHLQFPRPKHPETEHLRRHQKCLCIAGSGCLRYPRTVPRAEELGLLALYLTRQWLFPRYKKIPLSRIKLVFGSWLWCSWTLPCYRVVPSGAEVQVLPAAHREGSGAGAALGRGQIRQGQGEAGPTLPPCHLP